MAYPKAGREAVIWTSTRRCYRCDTIAPLSNAKTSYKQKLRLRRAKQEINEIFQTLSKYLRASKEEKKSR